MSLSRGKPKTTDDILRTVYLLTKANKVADIINIETKDFIKLEVKLSYRVNFEGDPESWFNVDNYVKFLCDHMRSKVRAAVQRLGIEEFYSNHTDFIRDIVLGEPKSVSPTIEPKRPGTLFAENGMKIYDVEVLDVKIMNSDIEKLLVNSQRSTFQNALLIADEGRKLNYVNAIEDLKQETAESRAETEKLQLALAAELGLLRLANDLQQIDAAAKTEAASSAQELESTKARLQLQNLSFEQTTIQHQAANELEQAKLEQRKEWLAAEVQAVVDKAKAVSPDLIAAMATFGEQHMVASLAQSMAPLSILGGNTVLDVAKQLLSGTPIAKQLTEAAFEITKSSKTKSNGNGATA